MKLVQCVNGAPTWNGTVYITGRYHVLAEVLPRYILTPLNKLPPLASYRLEYR
jgi:hypothetical protein